MWERESWWTYSGALSSEVDRERYWEVVTHALRKHFSQSDLVSGIGNLAALINKPFGTACPCVSVVLFDQSFSSVTALPSHVQMEDVRLKLHCVIICTLISPSIQLPELLQSSSYQLSCSQREALSKQLEQQLIHHSGLHINLYDVCMHVYTYVCGYQ